jgi:hypothetical protein
MQNKKISLIIIILFSSSLFSQDWDRSYNGPGNDDDFGRALVVDGQGNVIVTGISMGDQTLFDYGTVKYNSSGTQLWASRYDGGGWDKAYAICRDADNNVYVTGEKEYGSGLTYIATVMYNSSGVQQWVATYEGSSLSWGTTIDVDKSGNVYVGGVSYSASSDYDFITIKYNSSGVQQWYSIYNGSGNGEDVLNQLKVDGLGNAYVTGRSYGGSTGVDMVTIRYASSNGGQDWIEIYNGSGNGYDESISLALDLYLNVYITGLSREYYNSQYVYSMTTIRYNQGGALPWVQKYYAPLNGYATGRSIALFKKPCTPGGDLPCWNYYPYVTGYCSNASNPSNYDAITIKYDASGTQLWYDVRDFSIWDYPNSIAIDNDGNACIAGGTKTGTGESWDYLTAEYSINGSLLWHDEFNGYGNNDDFAYQTGFDGSGNIYVTGESVASNYLYDYVTLFYSSSGDKKRIISNQNLATENPVNLPNRLLLR